MKVKTANLTARNDRLPETADAKRDDWGVALTAALDWWRDAGVDGTFVDDPQDWLATARNASETVATAPLKPLRESSVNVDPALQPQALDRSTWPMRIEDFGAWWLAEPMLVPAGGRRFGPIGPVNADVMIVVPMPPPDEADVLLSGRAGRLLDAMLAAMGIARTDCYLASALPAHVPMPDWSALKAIGLGEMLMHHIVLAKPRRLLILGASGVSALLGHDLPNLAHGLRTINQDTADMAVMPAWDLDAMLARPALKAGFWSRWLDWTGTQE